MLLRRDAANTKGVHVLIYQSCCTSSRTHEHIPLARIAKHLLQCCHQVASRLHCYQGSAYVMAKLPAETKTTALRFKSICDNRPEAVLERVWKFGVVLLVAT